MWPNGEPAALVAWYEAPFRDLRSLGSEEQQVAFLKREGHLAVRADWMASLIVSKNRMVRYLLKHHDFESMDLDLLLSITPSDQTEKCQLLRTYGAKFVLDQLIPTHSTLFHYLQEVVRSFRFISRLIFQDELELVQTKLRLLSFWAPTRVKLVVSWAWVAAAHTQRVDHVAYYRQLQVCTEQDLPPAHLIVNGPSFDQLFDLVRYH